MMEASRMRRSVTVQIRRLCAIILLEGFMVMGLGLGWGGCGEWGFGKRWARWDGGIENRCLWIGVDDVEIIFLY